MLSPLLIVVYTDWVDNHNRVYGGVTVESCSISRLLFADDLLLLAFFEQDRQHALDRLSAAYDQTGMKINNTKIEVLCLFRDPVGVCCKQARKHYSRSEMSRNLWGI